MKKNILFLALSFTFVGTVFGQNNSNNGYWQQQADYKMDVKVDVKKFTYTGNQEVVYTNNSNDTLKEIFYHLYYNAFQPGSDMDELLKSIPDPDRRMVDTKTIRGKKVTESRIAKLKPNEIGSLKVTNIFQDGVAATKASTVGTILKVTLPKPILPKSKTVLSLNFEGQAPTMIRRSGRESKEGVALSMAQWFPKLAEYDFEGWHVEQYLGREFHSVWSNFDVKISIDKNYTLGGTGVLVNNNEIGHGYQDHGVVVDHKKDKTLTWHFKAENVLDFTWAADNDYLHDIYEGPNGVKLHFLYKNNPKIIENWKELQPITAKLMEFFNENIGDYQYPQYSVIQGGDGGMEYSMCTLITGERTLPSLVGVTAHELAHNWFQHVLATNETKHEWMDEGFTTFISDLAIMKVLPQDKQEDTNPFASNYKSYYNLVDKNLHEPLSTHSDHYLTNRAYSVSAYSRGSIFLTQLSYIIGWDNMMKAIKRYYEDFKFTHPTPNDFKRSAERVSGAVLDWYMIDWTLTNNTIDYALQFVEDIQNDKTLVTLGRIGRSGMPLDILVTYTDGTMETFYIPYTSMHWIKPNPYLELNRNVLTGWGWGNPTYKFIINKPKSSIQSILIDPSQFMADINQENNLYQQ